MFEDEDPEFRASAGPELASWGDDWVSYYWNYFEEEHISGLCPPVLTDDMDLGPLRRALRDPNPSVRSWAAIHLTGIAPQTPGLADALAGALSAGPDGGLDDGGGYGSGCVLVAEALAQLGPAAWDSLGPAAVRGLHAALLSGRAPEWYDEPNVYGGGVRLRASTLARVALALARLGAVSAEVLVALHDLGQGGVDGENVIKLSREAFESLSERLRRDEAIIIPNRPDEGFLLWIWTNPTDETYRLAYADWLDEHDQPVEAQFIRVEIEKDRTFARDLRWRELDDAMSDLRAAHWSWADWWGKFRRASSSDEIRRAGGTIWPETVE